jgi:hypothetical protein
MIKSHVTCFYCKKILVQLCDLGIMVEGHPLCNNCKKREVKKLMNKYNILSDIEM